MTQSQVKSIVKNIVDGRTKYKNERTRKIKSKIETFKIHYDLDEKTITDNLTDLLMEKDILFLLTTSTYSVYTTILYHTERLLKELERRYEIELIHGVKFFKKNTPNQNFPDLPEHIINIM